MNKFLFSFKYSFIDAVSISAASATFTNEQYITAIIIVFVGAGISTIGRKWSKFS